MKPSELSVQQIRERALASGIQVTERAVHEWLATGKIPAREEPHGSRVWRFATVEVVDAYLRSIGGNPPTTTEATTGPVSSSLLAEC